MNITIGAPEERTTLAPAIKTRTRIKVADEPERESIYRLRHEIYGKELQQHALNQEESLKDLLDLGNIYLVALERNMVAGFISITPPAAPAFSIDKYFKRAELPFQVTDKTYEIRLLTVVKEHRGRSEEHTS